jgi:hypothetical protein
MSKYKNIFVLTTGRAGSTTFSRACQFIEGYSASHESLNDKIGKYRFEYPEMHIEVDNRLAWHLGHLNEIYGNDAFYVFLKRRKTRVADSFAARGYSGIMHAFGNSGIVREGGKNSKLQLAEFYVDTVYANINHFLQDKDHLVVEMENIEEDFMKFLDACQLRADLGSIKECLATEFNTRASHKQGIISHLRSKISYFK